MAAPPLSHHEILALVEPFSRRGRPLDLAASDRLARRLVFKPLPAAAGAAHAGPPERLQLDNPGPGSHRLTRSFSLPGGLLASVQADGPAPGALLARIEVVDVAQLWRSGPGYRIALQLDAQPALGSTWATGQPAPDAGPPAVRLVLLQAVVQLDGLQLKLRVPSARGTAADLSLQASGASQPDLPEDLLALLGWNWARLRRSGSGWSSKLRLRGAEPQRSQGLVQALEQAARHLVASLAAPPADYHRRWRLARWGVFFRRAIPLLTFVALAGLALGLPQLGLPVDSMARIMVFDLPLIVLALSLCLQEMSSFEIPPWPRRLPATAWGLPPAAAQQGQTPVAGASG